MNKRKNKTQQVVVKRISDTNKTVRKIYPEMVEPLEAWFKYFGSKGVKHE